MDITCLKNEMDNLDFSKEYIDICINYAKNLEQNGFPVIFDLKHFSLLSGIKSDEIIGLTKHIEKSYNELIILKRSGGERKINAPSENLKYIQRWILDNILYCSFCEDSATGFIPNKSIVDNARVHVGKECVINLDIKDFFPSIRYRRVYSIFYNFGYSHYLASLFTKICTLNNVLPQGAPTSPYISNLVCRKMDIRFSKLANKIGATYTRYADDITFSGNQSICKYINLIRRIIMEENFIINEKKVRVLSRHHQQTVTGLIVNSKLSVPNEIKKYLRQQIYYSQKYGVNNNLKYQNLKKSNYKGHLFGLAYYINMIEEELGKYYLDELRKIHWDS